MIDDWTDRSFYQFLIDLSMDGWMDGSVDWWISQWIVGWVDFM